MSDDLTKLSTEQLLMAFRRLPRLPVGISRPAMQNLERYLAEARRRDAQPHRNGESINPEIDGYYWLEDTVRNDWVIFWWSNAAQRWAVGKSVKPALIVANLGVVRIYGPIVPWKTQQRPQQQEPTV